MEQFIKDPFLVVLNMSITASYVIVLVIIARLLLKKAPKVFSYCLWSIVLFRLVCPISFSSALSFFRLLHQSSKLEYVPADLGLMGQPQIDLGIAPINNAVNGSLPAANAYASANPMQVQLAIFNMLWVMGLVCLLIYSVMSYLAFQRKIQTAVRVEANIFECEGIDSPFVIGLIKPKIYLPLGLSQSERSYVLKHEQTHIKRFDYLLKPLAYLVLCIHWFNPLVWISFLLMSRDMEMSCDESVLKTMGTEIKKEYSSSLLNFAAGRRLVSGSPLAFGEVNAKSRIQNVLNYHRLPVWIIITTIVLLLVMSIGLISNPEAQTRITEQEKSTMASTWAEALKTRDGKPRYELMSEGMKENFISTQKQRSDPWNFNIGVSSPWVVDYEITINGNSADILYHMTDSTNADYEKQETIYFGKENNKTVVVDAQELLSDWERYHYYAPSAEEAMQAYSKALLTSDYSIILALTPSAKLEPVGQQVWNTIKISDVKGISSDVREQKACYELELTIEDGGNSAFEKGVFPRWLWLMKGEQGWYAVGLMTSGEPDQSWWNSKTSGDGSGDPLFGANQWATGTYGFDQLLYLSPLSSSTFDYAENQMKGTQFTIGKELFEIDFPKGDNYKLEDPVYTKAEMTADMIQAFENSTMGKVSISEYKEKYRYDIYTKDNQKTNYCIYIMDNQLWLASYADNTADKSEITMNLWKLN